MREPVVNLGPSRESTAKSRAPDASPGRSNFKLEARGLIERLVDGQIVRTEAGQLLAKAVSGALQLGHPVTSAIVRLLAAIRQVGTLYVKERKVRMMPHKWAEVERLTGLGPQEFQEAVHIARLGHYIGEVNITEAGLDLLAVQGSCAA